MPFSPCCKRKYSKPCDCNPPPPSHNCECVEERGQCPPLPSSTEETDASTVQLYTPVIAAAPVSKKCCCEVKPKKSLWQQLFGDRKCCAPSKCCTPREKKKQDCCCKPKKKPCVPKCTNVQCCPEAPRLSTPPAPKPCKPCCCKKEKVNKCRTSCKPCCPSPESVFGCHFYCNVENRERKKRSRRKCCCCCCPTDTDVTTEDEKVPPPYKYTNDEPRQPSPVPRRRTVESEKSFPRMPSEDPEPERPDRFRSMEEPPPPPPLPPPRPKIYEPPRKVPERKPHQAKPTLSNFHIGLTFTNTETKYYKNNSGCPPSCPPFEDGNEHHNNNRESSEKIITLEIHQSEDNVNRERNRPQDNRHKTAVYRSEVDEDRNWPQNNRHSRDEETLSISSKRRRLSEMHEDDLRQTRNSGNYPKDERHRRNSDNYPEDERLRRNSDNYPEDERPRRNSDNYPEDERYIRNPNDFVEDEIHRQNSDKYPVERLSLDHRIGSKHRSMKQDNGSTLRSTRSGEKRRHNTVETNEDELDKRVLEILRRLSTIENKINKFDSHKRDTREIPVYGNKTYKIETDGNKSTIAFRINDGNPNDRTEKNNGNRKPDAVIEIRKSRSKSYSPTRDEPPTPSSRHRYARSLDRGTRAQRDQPKLVIKLPHGNKISDGFVSMTNNNRTKDLDYRDSEWMEVSNELKNRKNSHCYCYDCVCKRVSCQK